MHAQAKHTSTALRSTHSVVWFTDTLLVVKFATPSTITRAPKNGTKRAMPVGATRTVTVVDRVTTNGVGDMDCNWSAGPVHVRVRVCVSV